jgi:hypothetical protein
MKLELGYILPTQVLVEHFYLRPAFKSEGAAYNLEVKNHIYQLIISRTNQRFLPAALK